MKIVNLIALILTFGIILSPKDLLQAQDTNGIQMTKVEWQKQMNELKTQKAHIIVNLDSLNKEIDSLKLRSAQKNKDFEKCEIDLYNSVGTTKSGIVEFRKKFERIEKMVNGRTNARDTVKKYFDEIIIDKANCLTEFWDRYSRMQKSLDNWGVFTGPFLVPSATSSDVLSNNLFINRTFQEVATIIQSTLEINGYTENKYYRVIGGFAIVTKIEQINEDGNAFEGDNRFSQNIPADYNFWEILKHSYINYESHWRTFVFIVTNRSMDYSTVPGKFDIRIYRGGGRPELRRLNIDVNTMYDDGFSFNIFVYENKKQNNTEDSKILSNSETKIYAKKHLEKAGLNKLLE
jgi:hypothetical protein